MRDPAIADLAVELAGLHRAWAHVAGGAGGSGARPRLGAASRTAVITGVAGSGKTRIAASALESLAPRPATILVGTARVHSPAPYDWLASLLSQHEHIDAPVPPVALAWLRQDPDVPADRYAPGALLRIAVRVVRFLVGPGPAVAVVEDLHALDPASLNLVAELAAAPDLPVLLLVTSRPTDSPPHAMTLARLAGTAGAIRARLDGAPAPADLTARERDVLAGIAEGLSNQQIATRLGISVRTVGVHVSNLLRKTRSRSRTDAALWAIRHRPHVA